MNVKLITKFVLLTLSFRSINCQENITNDFSIPNVENCQELSEKLKLETFHCLNEMSLFNKQIEVKHEFNPVLFEMVQDIAAKMDIAVPITKLCHFDKPNAAAIECNNKFAKQIIAIDPRLILQSENQAYTKLKFILAHEMAHLHYGHNYIKKKRDESSTAKLFATLPIMAMGKVLSKFGLCNIKSPLATCALLTTYGLINGYQALSDAKISKKEEIEADLKAIEITKDIDSAINVIKSLNEQNLKSQVLPKSIKNLFSCFKEHPTYLERIQNLISNHRSLK